MTDLIYSIDKAAAEFMAGIQCPFLTAVMKAVTLASDKGLIWIALGLILLCFKRTRRFGITYALTLLTAFILSEYTVKLIVCRQRPFIALENIKLLIEAPSGYSFPSSHSCTSAACALCIFLQSRRYGIAALIFALLVAFSRVYFNVHYLSDVIAGIALGAIVSAIISAVSKKIRNRSKACNIEVKDADQT